MINEDIIEKIFVYKGNKYVVLEEATFKNPYSRQWEACIIYRNVEETKTYVRQTKEFLNRFERV